MAKDVASLLRATPPEDISEPMLRQLIADKVAESQHLEFKEDWSRDKMELRKDAVALANGGGGTIIYGIKEDREHKAESFQSVTNAVNAEEQIQASLVTKIDPTLRFHIRRTSVDNRELLILRVEPPDNPPHCLEHDEWNRRFPIRQNRDTRPMTMDEIRNAMHGDQLRRDVSIIREGMQRLLSGKTPEPALKDLSDQDLVRKAKDASEFADELLKRLR